MIYLDHAATTPICDAAKKAIIDHLDDFGNPSSVHELGRKARLLIENARERIAKCINAEPDKIYFTSGGSEANSLALNEWRPIASNIEHHSIISDSIIKVDKNGDISAQEVDQCIQNENPRYYFPIEVCSCMYVNNEIGKILPVKELAEAAHNNMTWFHTDAVQAVGHIPIDITHINCDMLSASGHKFGGPKGIGFMYVTNGIPIIPLINGGKQENGFRPGTENVLGIISMAAALEDAVEHMDERNQHIKYLRDKMLDKLLQIPGSHLNGSLENRVVSNINIRFDSLYYR